MTGLGETVIGVLAIFVIILAVISMFLVLFWWISLQDVVLSDSQPNTLNQVVGAFLMSGFIVAVSFMLSIAVPVGSHVFLLIGRLAQLVVACTTIAILWMTWGDGCREIVSSWKLDIDPVGWSGFKPAGDRSESCERWAPKFRFVVVLQVGIALIALIIGSLLE